MSLYPVADRQHESEDHQGEDQQEKSCQNYRSQRCQIMQPPRKWPPAFLLVHWNESEFSRIPLRSGWCSPPQLFDLLLQQTDLVVHLLALLLLLLQTLLQDEDGLLIPLQSPLQQLDLLGSRRGPVAVVR
jgi:hypothetical protein